MRGTLEWPTVDLVTHRRKSTPQRTAVIDASETGRDQDSDDAPDRWTYREFDRHVDHTLAGLESSRGDRIGVLMDTRPAFASVFFAAMRSASTVVPLSVRETAPELARKVERTDVDAIVCESATESRALEVADRHVPVYSVDDPATDEVLPLSRAAAGGVPDPVPIDRETTQLVGFTSGTSGEPKAVRLTVGNLVASATASAFRLGVDPDERWLCCLPMYHVGGIAPVIRSTLYGTTVVIQRTFEPEATAEILEEYAITGVSLVPTMLQRLLETDWSPPDSLRFVLLGGAPASRELLERCERTGVPVYPTYGMTETASQIATATPSDTVTHPETIGQPLAFVDVSIVSDDGEVPAPGTVGELVVDGPVVTPGYLDDERTAEAFGPRGLHTGDVGYRDEDGYLWVINRRSDRIVTGGENVDPGAVTAVLRSHPGITAAAVVGLQDDEWGERVGALVVPTGSPPSPDAVLEYCEGRLAGFKRPKTIGYGDELPRTASGTVDREAVRERLSEHGRNVSSR